MSQRKVNSIELENRLAALEQDLKEIDFDSLLLEEVSNKKEDNLEKRLWEKISSEVVMKKFPNILRAKSPKIKTVDKEEENTNSPSTSYQVNRGTQTSAKLEANTQTETEVHNSNKEPEITILPLDTKPNLVTSPNYGPRITNTTAWEISEPILLTKEDFGSEFIDNTTGIILSRGSYKIEYNFVNIKPGTGLGLYHQIKKYLKKPLVYFSNEGNSGSATQFRGEAHFHLGKEALLAVANGRNGKIFIDFIGVVHITVHKRVTSPN